MLDPWHLSSNTQARPWRFTHTCPSAQPFRLSQRTSHRSWSLRVAGGDAAAHLAGPVSSKCTPESASVLAALPPPGRCPQTLHVAPLCTEDYKSAAPAG